MSDGTLPSYLVSAKPNPLDKRAPWYSNTAPAYAGIFLWIAFYDSLGSGLKLGNLSFVLLGLVLAGLACHFLFYRVFGTLGMKTGLPLYVVGSSTFGTKGGLLFPGVFMGLLQIGWYSVATFYSTRLVLGGLGLSDHAMTVFDPDPSKQHFDSLFVIIAVVWGYFFAFLGALGIKYVAKMSQFFPIVPLAMLVIAAIGASKGLATYKPIATSPNNLAAALLMVQLVVGFFATAGAAGVDFGTNSRNQEDVCKGGFFGIFMAILVTGGLAVVAVAGAHGLKPGLESVGFADALPIVNPKLAKYMLLLFAIGSMAPACFCASIIGNSLSTMIPSLPRVPLTLGGATIGIILAATGISGNLGAFFGLIGASFGPICGAMVADYFLSGKKWAGPREGISLPGYAAWIVGFLVGISNNALVTSLLGHELLPSWHPTSVYSFVIAFIVYAKLAKEWGLTDKEVQLPGVPKA